jgi:hypothetical protein
VDDSMDSNVLVGRIKEFNEIWVRRISNEW